MALTIFSLTMAFPSKGFNQQLLNIGKS